jgi:hypothetical protein
MSIVVSFIASIFPVIIPIISLAGGPMVVIALILIAIKIATVSSV